MPTAQQLGELWICLRPNKEELGDCGSRLIHQQQIILEVIKQFVFIQLPATGDLSRRPAVLQHLHQLIHFNYTSKYLVIQDIPEVTEE
jgi:hypothetical protein